MNELKILTSAFEEYKKDIDGNITFEDYLKANITLPAIKPKNTFLKVIENNFYRNNFLVSAFGNMLVLYILMLLFHNIWICICGGVLTFNLLRNKKDDTIN